MVPKGIPRVIAAAVAAAIILAGGSILARRAAPGEKPRTVRWLKAALHVHTTASDGTATALEMIQAYADADFKVVAITDHDRWYLGRTGIVETAGRRILVVSGNEHTAQRFGHNFHMLEIRDGRGGRVLIVAHPAFTGLTQTTLDSLSAQCFERWTWASFVQPWGCCLDPYLYVAHGKGAICSDDAHCVAGAGHAATWIYADMTAESVVAALRAGAIVAQPPPAAERYRCGRNGLSP